MFTGLITDVGTIERVTSTDAGREFRIRTAYGDLVAGESIAVSGACLTVRECGGSWFTVAAVVTTVGRTTVGEWSVGRSVNLERALSVGDRFGGHIVQGHVDGVAEVLRVALSGDALLVDLLVPTQLMPMAILHGSICVDGVSLTVNEIPDAQTIQVSLIDVTRRVTTLGSVRAGDRLNTEMDVIAKYMQRLAAVNAAAFSLPSSF